MAVQGKSYDDAVVPQSLLHNLGVNTSSQQQANMGVRQVVYASLFLQLLYDITIITQEFPLGCRIY
ncbi:hypothetical protein hamaS1_21980 [Moorella sp. Hama-1]|nr:hypothetical protein hamaS1_21980 [Moorella sp. Hama-1]